MIELNKKRRWFQRCIKSFKSSRQKWIKKQEDTLKKKGFLIKYVFLDDVKKIQGYKEKPGNKKGGKGKGKKYKNKVKIKARDGGVIVLKDVEFVVLDDDDDDGGDGGNGNGKGKKKKGKKSKGDQLDEIEDYMAELEKEFGMDQAALGGADDYKDLDSDDDFDMDADDVGDLDGDYTLDQLAVDAAADNVDGDDDDNNGGADSQKNGNKTPSGGKSPGGGNKGGGRKSGKKSPSGSGGGKGGTDYLALPVQNSIDAGDTAALQAQLVYLKKELDDRTDDLEKLKEIMSDGETYPDPKGEVKNYILQINKRGDEVVEKLDKELHVDKDDVDGMKANNDRWQLWINKLAGAMAQNGNLFNQLLEVYEYYLKELKGRIDDLTVVNNNYYTDKNNDDKPKDGDGDGGDDEEQQEENGGGDGDGDGDNDNEEKKDENGGGDDGDNDLRKLKKTVGDRHVDVEGQFKNIQEKQDVDAEEEEKNKEEDYGAGDKEREELGANTDKVKEIRDNLVSNNRIWRELIDSVTTDYDKATSDKNKLVSGLNEAKNELKQLIDLVVNIPKRKILDDNYGGNDDDNDNNEQQEEEAAGGDDDAGGD